MTKVLVMVTVPLLELSVLVHTPRLNRSCVLVGVSGTNMVLFDVKEQVTKPLQAAMLTT